jgi:TPR repeat protein
MGGLFGFAALIALTFVAIPDAWRLVTGLMQSTSGSLTSITPKEPDALAVAIKQRAERLRSGVSVSEDAGQQRQEAVQQTKEAMQQTKDPPDPQLPVSSPPVVAQPAPLVQAPEPSPRPLDFVTRQLPRDELASMLKRGDDFVKSGDLSSARLLLRRAAESGDGNAALTLAGTFDPNVLKALGFRDAGNIAMARLWYERAEKLGSAEALQRLRQLATINEAQ